MGEVCWGLARGASGGGVGGCKGVCLLLHLDATAGAELAAATTACVAVLLLLLVRRLQSGCLLVRLVVLSAVTNSNLLLCFLQCAGIV